jgi:5-methylcytosine-specific restriction endonuclease McrA
MAQVALKKKIEFKPKGKRKTAKPKNNSQLIKELDALLSHKVRDEAGGICFMCGGIATQVHHYWTKKAHGKVRFDERNLLPMCWNCHINKVHRSLEIEDLRRKLIKKIGQKGFDDLYRLAHEPYKWTADELTGMIEHLKGN